MKLFFFENIGFLKTLQIQTFQNDIYLYLQQFEVSKKSFENDPSRKFEARWKSHSHYHQMLIISQKFILKSI